MTNKKEKILIEAAYGAGCIRTFLLIEKCMDEANTEEITINKDKIHCMIESAIKTYGVPEKLCDVVYKELYDILKEDI